jgi:hypothetical protein
MVKKVHGFGPPSAHFSHRLFLQGTQPVQAGSQLTWIVLHETGGVRLAVEFPGSSASAELLEPIAVKGEVHQFSLLVPTGTPVIELVPIGVAGQPLVELCTRYRTIQDDFEARPMPSAGPTDEVDDGLASMEARLGGEGRSESCALCGELCAASAGVRFGQLEGTEGDALRLMLPHVDQGTFVCDSCRSRRLGTREKFLGGAGRAQAVGFVLAQVALRGYLAALLGRHQLGVTSPGATTVLAFLGAFLPMELLPIVAVELARGALGMMALLLAPLVFVAFLMNYPDETLQIVTGDLGLLFEVTGLTKQNLLNEVVVVRGVSGALLAAAVAFGVGGGDARALTALGERLRGWAREMGSGAKAGGEAGA